MGQLRIMKPGHGDLLLAEWSPLDSASVSVAQRAYDTNLKPGSRAFRLWPGEPGRSEPLTGFQEEADDILIVPAIVGG